MRSRTFGILHWWASTHELKLVCASKYELWLGRAHALCSAPTHIKDEGNLDCVENLPLHGSQFATTV